LAVSLKKKKQQRPTEEGLEVEAEVEVVKKILLLVIVICSHKLTTVVGSFDKFDVTSTKILYNQVVLLGR